MPEDDLSFLYEQARRYVTARPWERLARTSLYLDLKAGSWHEFCAQHFSNPPLNALFVFAGHQSMVDLQRAGMAEPPDGTIFVELIDDPIPPEAIAEVGEYGWPAELRPIPFFQAITSEGWLPLKRSQTRLLALALAAITDFDVAADAGDSEIAGELNLPAASRGRYRARRAPTDDENIVPVVGMPRQDLYGDQDCSLSFAEMAWPDYWALRARAQLCRPAPQPLEERGGQISLLMISGSREQAAEIARRLDAAEPLGIAFGEMDGVLTAILAGTKESYVLLQAEEQREELMLWRHTAVSSSGAIALVVEDVQGPRVPGDGKVESVHAIFECRVGAG